MSTIAILVDAEEKPKPQQLRMVWPQHLLNAPPVTRLHAGYALRTYRPGDELGFIRVMDLAGFTGWTEASLLPWLDKVLPNGWFLAIEQATGQIVATAMATHNPNGLHPFGGELGWVAGDPTQAGKGLGWSVCAAVTARFLSAGYQNIYLRTDDWRLPAIKTYLKLGYQPFLFAPDMAGRWEAICAQLAWPFAPLAWPKSKP